MTNLFRLSSLRAIKTTFHRFLVTKKVAWKKEGSLIHASFTSRDIHQR
ncbi:hypothetical protein CU026_1020 [Enterococcus faecium]|nr:hypothetical protein M7W_309 [Enterococcus faecium ATCC 8459 = NRRL B-2354]MBK4750668.1 hypothetical protein [Enterococcus faecium]MBK4756026.1 hypothetical protein [Enterococcus faecium]MBK4761217.1 hypothetical protein [Enterococcus faecium]MBK4766872.1 hypothetical protein [Enterococcus faecium]